MVTGITRNLLILTALAFAAAGLPFRRVVAAPVHATGDFAWREALPGYKYQFPRDHFEHPAFRTEWWYYTGNVTDTSGRRFGFELVFFRQGESAKPDSASVWSIRDLYLAHAALTDASGKHFWYDERLNRGGPGIAGASFADRRVWNGNWQVRWSGDHQTLDAITDKFQFHIALAPMKPFVIQGENGVSQKAAGKGRASHYVSFPLLGASGTITEAGIAYKVHGTAWMDHEWFSEQLAENESGWDWFSIQLNNNTEVMLYELRRKDGAIDPYSSGTYIDAKGAAHHLRNTDFTVQPLAKCGKYPILWRVRIPSLNIDLTCKPVLDNQELRAHNGGPSYWEGAVDYSGTQKGVGYLEMTGYDAPVRL